MYITYVIFSHTHTHEACCFLHIWTHVHHWSFPREHRSQLSVSCRWWCPSWQRRVWLSISACLSWLWLKVTCFIWDWFLKRDGLCIEPPQKDRTTWIFLSTVMGNLRWETQLSVAKKLMQRVTGTARFSHCTGCGTTWNDICLKMVFLSPISENGFFIPWYIWACRFYPQYQTIHGHFDQCMLLWGTSFWDESSWCMSKEDQQSPKRRMGWEDARAQSQHHFSERTAKGLLNTFQPEPRFLTLKEQVLGCIASRAVQYLKRLSHALKFWSEHGSTKKVAAKRGTSQHCNISQNWLIWKRLIHQWMEWGTRVLYFPTQPHTDHYLALPDCHLVPQVETARRKEYETRKDLQVRAVRFEVSSSALKSGRFLLRKSCRVSCGSRISIHPHLRSGQLLEWCLLIGCYALMYLLYSSHVILSKITFPVTKERIWSPRSILQFSYSWF